MAQEIRDYKDIQDAIMEQLKYQSTDSESRNRIKRDINMIYDQVLMYHKWWWLKGHTTVRLEPKITTGTVSVTQDSTTITFSTAPTVDLDNYYINFSGQNEVYQITAHTADSTTATLDVSYIESTNSSIGYTVWNPVVNLPTDCREVDTVWHDHLNEPLRPVGPDKLRELMASTGWTVQQRPRYYSVIDYYAPTSPEVESDRYRQIIVHPSILEKAITLKIDYIKEVTSLDSDTDEPIMPIEDRMVLFYGACAHAWHRERDPEAASRYDALFQQRLAQMLGKQQDSMDTPKLHSSRTYLDKKRRGPGGSSSMYFPLTQAEVSGSSGGDEVVTWTNVALNDNQSVEQVILTENKKALFIKYAIRRGNSNAECGEMFICTPTDLSSAAYSPTVVEVGDTGITLIGAVSGVNLQLKYTSTSTGSAADMWYYLVGPA